MTRVRAMLLVPETTAFGTASLTMSSRAVSQTMVVTPKGFTLDEAFPPVPLEAAGSASLLSMSLAAASLGKPTTNAGRAHMVRGSVEVSEFDSARHDAELADGSQRLFADPEIAHFTCASDPPVGDAGDVRRLLQLSKLHAAGRDGRQVAVAIVDTGINLAYLQSLGLAPKLDVSSSWAPRRTVGPGQAPPDHGTMCAYDALLAAPQATLLDYAVLSSTRKGGSAMAGVLSDAVLAYSRLLNPMSLDDDQRPFQSLVVSNSWGMYHESWDFPVCNPGRYADNLNHPFNIIVTSLASAGADILFAAGNCGPKCADPRCLNMTNGTIMGANSHPDVITVAGVDTTGTVAGYSSHALGRIVIW